MSKIPNKHLSLSPSKVVFRQGRTTAGSQQRNSSVRNSLNNVLKIGDRVSINGKSGTIAFIGPTQFSDGEWIGINLDEPQGKNDGSHNGVRYFETDANHGLFCRADKVQRLAINGAPQRHSLYNPSRLSAIEGASNNILGISKINKLDLSSTKNLQIGDRVTIRGEKYGTLQYIGKIHTEQGIWCGIKLDGPLGKNDGKIEGKRYFTCPQRFGLFAPLRLVEKVVTDSNDSQILARQSIISTDSNNQYHEIASLDSHLDELSTSSNEATDFPPRSPKKIKQPILSADLTVMETSLSSQVANLSETIKEKDLFIKSLQRQYEIKENENEHLIKQQLELTQHIKDLQFLESNKDDDHWLLSPDQIRIDEKTKEKILELESINKTLTQENETFQEELKRLNELIENQSNTFTDELEKQIELLKLQVTDLQNKEQIKSTQLVENDTFYQQQIKKYQSQIDQIIKEEQNVQLRLTILEQEKQTNEERVHDLLNELTRYKDSIIPDLEKQCQILESELQNRINLALNEREIYYEQQIKEYQDNINQATRETEQIRAELKQIHEENNLKEQKTNELINELKENYEKVQIELNNQERQIDMNSNQYEQQIKDYENNLNQVTHETQNIQTELAKIEEDKSLHDNKSNTTINSLKEDYERQYEILKNQLIELQNHNQTQNLILNGRITHYDTEIKEYQIKIDQDDHEIQNLRAELKSLQEEKMIHEQQLNKTIETLKQSQYEFQTELDELNERERKANRTLHQREAQFEQKIEEYQKKLEQANLTSQQLQSELQEEKTNFNNTINSLTQDLERLKTELQDRDRTENSAFSEHEAHYKSEIQEYRTKREESLLEIQDLQLKLTNLQEEKTVMENELNETINTLEQDYEELQNKQTLDTHNTLHQRDLELEQQTQEYQEKLEQADLAIQHLQSELEKLQEEKTNFNDTMNSLIQELERMKTELQHRDQTENTVFSEREAHYKSEIQEHKSKRDESLLEIQDLQSKLTNLQEEKTAMENELNETINTLKQDYEELQNKQELDAHNTLHQRDLQLEQQTQEYQEKLEQADLTIQHLQSKLEKLQEEKIKSNDTMNSLILELERMKTELQNRDQTENTVLNEREAHYKSEIQDLQSKLAKLQENTTMENELKITINTLKQDYEKLQNEQKQREKIILKECQSHYEHDIDEYQKNLELSIRQTSDVQLELVNLQEEKESNEKILNDMINSLKIDFEKQIEILKIQNIELKKQDEIKEQQLKKYQSEFNRTEELTRRIENLTLMNETLKNELQDVQSQNNSTEIEELTQQVNDLQQMHLNLLEKQAIREQQYAEEKQAQEKFYKEKTDEYEMKIALVKNEYMVEMENTKLDHDQEILRLKGQIQRLTPTKGKK